jgi:hypothetical protein
MTFEFASGKKWFAAIFAVVAFAGFAMVVWNVRAHKASSSSTTTITQKETAVPSTSPKPAEEVVPQVPKLYPGDTCEKAISVLGKPTEENQYVLTWQKIDFRVTAAKDSKCVLTDVGTQAEFGHRVLTDDGVILGVSTLADAERILQPRIKEDSESVEAPEDNWSAMISIGPTLNAPYKVTYRADLKPGAADRMSHDPVFDDFRNLPVNEYSLEMVAPAESIK